MPSHSQGATSPSQRQHPNPDLGLITSFSAQPNGAFGTDGDQPVSYWPLLWLVAGPLIGIAAALIGYGFVDLRNPFEYDAWYVHSPHRPLLHELRRPSLPSRGSAIRGARTVRILG